jgi:cytochrome b561
MQVDFISNAGARLPIDSQSWNGVAKAFHWLIAALIFAQFALGWLASSGRLSPAKLNLFVWHKSVGILILALVLLRLLWRLATPAPSLPAEIPAWERAAARVSHVLLYVLMLALPLSGWVINSAAAVPLRIFWLIPFPAIAAPDRRTEEFASSVHFWLFVLLAALLLLHVAAALRHHFVKHNDVLTWMLPTRKAPK